ncbi:hypothetical protein [Actinomadura rugatobispora]|uniref:Lysoplasmalogenase n=1 Tax=Actinomadura rugatobispora TaxID=1994 RepID=A0ABW1AD27_9ACTN|nr:hypothetical protein GCM10010200_004460 [Actinomadura rugatobispora]
MIDTCSGHGSRIDAPSGAPSHGRRLRSRWPVLAGMVAAGLTAYGLAEGAELAPVLTASALVYLAAAALRKPAAAWPLFWGAFAVIALAKVMVPAVDPTWVLLGTALAAVVYGLLTGAARPAEGLPLQTVAMAGFGLVAAVTVVAGAEFGAYLVAAGLLGHAAWDVRHHRTGKVVVRSLAEFCFVLDALAAVAMVIVAVRG